MNPSSPIISIIPFDEGSFTALKQVLSSVCVPLPTAQEGDVVAVSIVTIYDDKGRILIEAPSQFLRKSAAGYRLHSWKELALGQPDYLRLALLFSRLAVMFPIATTFEAAIRELSSGEDQLERLSLVLTMNGVGIMAVHPSGESLVQLASNDADLQQIALTKCVQLIVPEAPDNHTRLRLGLANRHIVDVLRVAHPQLFKHVPTTVSVP